MRLSHCKIGDTVVVAGLVGRIVRFYTNSGQPWVAVEHEMNGRLFPYTVDLRCQRPTSAQRIAFYGPPTTWSEQLRKQEMARRQAAVLRVFTAARNAEIAAL